MGIGGPHSGPDYDMGPTRDEQDAYDLAVLLEDIERTVRNVRRCPCGCTDRTDETSAVVSRMFDRARMSGVVRYPQP